MITRLILSLLRSQKNAGAVAEIPVLGNTVLLQHFPGVLVAGGDDESGLAGKGTLLDDSLPDLKENVRLINGIRTKPKPMVKPKPKPKPVSKPRYKPRL